MAILAQKTHLKPQYNVTLAVVVTTSLVASHDQHNCRCNQVQRTKERKERKTDGNRNARSTVYIRITVATRNDLHEVSDQTVEVLTNLL